jgi:hypothetical protein
MVDVLTYRSECSNLRPAEVIMGNGPGNSEEVWQDEAIWVIIHICMVTTLEISLHSYLYLKLAKTLFSHYLLCFPFKKVREQGCRTTDSAQNRGEEEVGGTNNEYTTGK